MHDAAEYSHACMNACCHRYIQTAATAATAAATAATAATAAAAARKLTQTSFRQAFLLTPAMDQIG